MEQAIREERAEPVDRLEALGHTTDPPPA
jgi:hypothetical protein